MTTLRYLLSIFSFTGTINTITRFAILESNLIKYLKWAFQAFNYLLLLDLHCTLDNEEIFRLDEIQ